uniref:Uncharacterized protein n=1 Tax=Arundo donax TaxID=35708 RepID=A0A0A8YDZ9_ARUDO
MQKGLLKEASTVLPHSYAR